VNQAISKSGFIMEKIERSQLLAMKQMGCGEGSYAMDNMHKREMAIRTKDLRLVSKPMAEKIASSVGGQIVDLVLDSATEWAIMMEPIRNLRIYYILQRYNPEFEDEVIALYGKDAAAIGIPIDDLYDFTRLCANALVRAAKNLPTPA
jgi:hypothetical protein